jgi:hypothetical protein
MCGVAAAKSLVRCMIMGVEAFAFGMLPGTCESHAIAAFQAVNDVREHLARGKVLRDAAFEALALGKIVIVRELDRNSIVLLFGCQNIADVCGKWYKLGPWERSALFAVVANTVQDVARFEC